MSYYCGLIYRIDKILSTIQGYVFDSPTSCLKVFVILSIFYSIQLLLWLIVFWRQNCVYKTLIVMGKCAILILQKLGLGVCHCCYCPLIYNDSVTLSSFILNCHRTFFLSQILNLFICGIFEHNFLQKTKESITFKFWSLTISTATKFMLSNQAISE